MDSSSLADPIESLHVVDYFFVKGLINLQTLSVFFSCFVDFADALILFFAKLFSLMKISLIHSIISLKKKANRLKLYCLILNLSFTLFVTGIKNAGKEASASRYIAIAGLNLFWWVWSFASATKHDIRAWSCCRRSLKPFPSSLLPSLNITAASLYLPKDISDVPRFKYATSKKKVRK